MSDENANFEPDQVRHGRRIHELCGAVSRTSKKRAQAKLQKLGLSPGAYNLIRVVGDSDDMTLSAVSKVLRVETATLSSLAVRMERDGWLRREPSPDDKRAMLLKLTPHAIQIGKQADQIMALEMAALTHRLATGEQAQLIEMLERVMGNLDDAKS